MIKAPNWQKDAIPTTRGWTHPKTGELLVSRRISKEEIREYLEGSDEGNVKYLTEAPLNISPEEMTDRQLEEYNNQSGFSKIFDFIKG